MFASLAGQSTRVWVSYHFWPLPQSLHAGGVRPFNITHRYVHIYPANIARGWLGYPSYSPTSLSLSPPPSLPILVSPHFPSDLLNPFSDVPIYAGLLFDYVLYTDSPNDCP